MFKRVHSARGPVARVAERLIEVLEGRTMFNANYFPLASGDFLQDWTNTGLITANDTWTNVPAFSETTRARPP